jgi:hypothetical protein
MASAHQRSDTWHRVTSSAFLFLSSANPPDARAPGIVVGPNSRVRPCDGAMPRSQADVLCLEVDQDGQIDRGYTVARMIAFRPEGEGSPWTSRRIAVGAFVGVVGLVAGLFALL